MGYSSTLTCTRCTASESQIWQKWLLLCIELSACLVCIGRRPYLQGFCICLACYVAETQQSGRHEQGLPPAIRWQLLLALDGSRPALLRPKGMPACLQRAQGPRLLQLLHAEVLLGTDASGSQ